MLSFHGNLGAAIQYIQLTTISQGNQYGPILHVLRELILDLFLRFGFLREPTKHERLDPIPIMKADDLTLLVERLLSPGGRGGTIGFVCGTLLAAFVSFWCRSLS
jgi:hypothetical protein